VGGGGGYPRSHPVCFLGSELFDGLEEEADGVRHARVWQRVVGLVDTVIEGVVFDEELEALVVSVRSRKSVGGRCGRCGRRAGRYDRGEGRRRWRSLDVGLVRVLVEADVPRVNCPVHGPTVVQVPWARHGAGHTRVFDDTVAWLAVHCSKLAVTELMRIAWRTVGSIITRVLADIDASVDRLAGLRRIGIDEISYKRGYRYLTVVVDHDSGRLVWASPGRDEATLEQFFALLGEERAAQITHVSADAADWIARVVERRCPNAVRCADPFHVVKWAGDALDDVRREAWNATRGASRGAVYSGRRRTRWPKRSHELKRVRWALWKNPEHLTDHQQHQLEWIAGNHPGLWRGYRLKEGLRYVFAVKGEEGKQALDAWLRWASRSQLQPFIEVARRIRRNRDNIDATLDHNLSNALVESTNTKIRLYTRMAYGFRSPDALIALAMLALGSQRPALPSRP
jgi:transposase